MTCVCEFVRVCDTARLGLATISPLSNTNLTAVSTSLLSGLFRCFDVFVNLLCFLNVPTSHVIVNSFAGVSGASSSGASGSGISSSGGGGLLAVAAIVSGVTSITM